MDLKLHKNQSSTIATKSGKTTEKKEKLSK
jgi:hypothetical protein